MSKTTLLACIVCVCSALGHAAAQTKPVSLDVAVRTGLVEVEVTGRGAYAGDAVRVSVRRKVPRDVHVIVEPGMVLKSADGKVQNMVCQGIKYEQVGNKYRRVDVMVLNTDQRRSFVIEAFCRDFEKPTPSKTSVFEIGTEVVVDTPAARVIVHGREAKADLKAIQIAIWLQQGVSDQDLRARFKATDDQLKTARVLVQAATVTEQEQAAGAESVETSVEVGVLVQGLLDGLRKRPILPGPDGRRFPLLRRVGEIISEVELEVMTAADRGW